MHKDIKRLMGQVEKLAVVGDETHWGACLSILAERFDRQLTDDEVTLVSLRCGYGRFPSMPAPAGDVWAHFWPNGNPCGMYLSERLLREKLSTF